MCKTLDDCRQLISTRFAEAYNLFGRGFRLFDASRLISLLPSYADLKSTSDPIGAFARTLRFSNTNQEPCYSVFVRLPRCRVTIESKSVHCVIACGDTLVAVCVGPPSVMLERLEDFTRACNTYKNPFGGAIKSDAVAGAILIEPGEVPRISSYILSDDTFIAS